MKRIEELKEVRGNIATSKQIAKSLKNNQVSLNEKWERQWYADRRVEKARQEERKRFEKILVRYYKENLKKSESGHKDAFMNRLDEIRLIYSELEGISVNEAERIIKQKLKLKEQEGKKNENRRRI